MRAAQVTAKIKRLLGKSGAWTERKSAPDAYDRQQAREARLVLTPEWQKTTAERDARRKLLLDDPQYIALCVKADKLREERSNANYAQFSYRVTLGRNQCGFFTVLAEGDTFAEAFAALEMKLNEKA